MNLFPKPDSDNRKDDESAGVGHNTDVAPEQVVETDSAEEAETNSAKVAEPESTIESDDDDDAEMTIYTKPVYSEPASDPKESEKRLYVRTGETGKLRPPPIDPALMAAAQPYIDDIKGVHAGQVEGIFKIGNTLIAAKKALAHGVFGHMIKRELPFGQRFADMYMAVARHKILSKWKSISILPASVAVIYELTRGIEDDKLEELRADGSIHAGLRRGEAVQLRKRISKEIGSHKFPDLITALRVLDWFADKYAADPEPIGELIFHATVDSNGDLTDLEVGLGAISEWIGELSAISDRLYEEDQAEEQRKAAEEKAKRKAAWERREAARVAATSSGDDEEGEDEPDHEDDDEGEGDDPARFVERRVTEQE